MAYSSDQLEKIQKDYELISTKVQELKDHNMNLEKENKSFEKEVIEAKKSYESQSDRLLELNTTVTSKTSQYEDLKTQFNELNIAHKALANTVAELQLEKRTLLKEIDELDLKAEKIYTDNQRKEKYLDAQETAIKAKFVSIRNYEDEVKRQKDMLDYREKILVMKQKAGK